jgi:PDZ domain-containing secreted protein
MMVRGLWELTGATRPKYALWCVLVAAIILIVFFTPFYVGTPGVSVPTATITSPTTVKPP